MAVHATGRLAEFTIVPAPGNEREAMRRVADAVATVGLPEARLQRLETAVSEATMNAIEHGSPTGTPVSVSVDASDDSVVVKVTDHGGGRSTPTASPNLDAKLAGEQSPRGWGLFLIEEMVDEVSFEDEAGAHTVVMVMHREAAPLPLGPDAGRLVRTARVLDLTGDLDASGAAAMYGTYETIGPGEPIVMNFGDVGYINSAGIAWIIGFMQKARRDGRPVAAVGLTPHYRQIFAITRLSDFISVHDDEASAVAAGAHNQEAS